MGQTACQKFISRSPQKSDNVGAVVEIGNENMVCKRLLYGMPSSEESQIDNATPPLLRQIQTGGFGLYTNTLQLLTTQLVPIQRRGF